ncbi:MAG: prepilin-type N-terminal cleavage/methylation domain-containing protein [Firmicutes bacterium]|nr:prepilin-type N-terminal cleavage/methylation domain-containing protein [Bacillota bacterium]
MRRIKYKQWHQYGYTLLEVLATLSIIVILSTGIAGLFSSVARTWWTGASQAEAQYAARLAVERLSSEIRAATKLVLVESNRLVLINPDGNKIEFILTNHTLYRRFYRRESSPYPETAHPVTESVEELKFQLIDGGLVQIQVTVKVGPWENRLSTQTMVRAQAVP